MGEWTAEKIKERLADIKKDVESEGIKARGHKEILMFCNGKKLSPTQSIKAHCYQCMGYHNNQGENKDCENPVCPLYEHNPYNNKRVKRVVMSEEQRAGASARMKKYMRSKKND